MTVQSIKPKSSTPPTEAAAETSGLVLLLTLLAILSAVALLTV